MPLVLIKRDDGTAFISETIYVEGEPLPWEGGRQLAPDEIVDGKKVSDWPVGVFTVHQINDRLSDWNDESVEIQDDER